MTPARRSILALVALVLAVGATATWAQDFGRRRRAADISPQNIPYDGRFTFVRLRHGGAALGRGEPPWAHDYPRAERNFSRILEELTLIKPHLQDSNVFTLDDPELFAYPLAYMSEPGFWQMNEAELAGLQQYMSKGGFLIFDDFRGEHWSNFAEQVRRIIPNGQLVQLEASHPVFHSFFDINIAETQGYYGPASFHGVFEDNDPAKRLMLVANYNHDLGELWEFSDTGFVPVDLSNDAYKYGVNYVVYAMTH
ncbi:MAG TPA: DUF4159 domain-containing protein [Vicinamibacterales bacterium]|nr:DUF4159 domain-containing protein [Vicinamibacterales bacterium]